MWRAVATLGLVCSTLAAPAVHANDSVAELATGGLRLSATRDIAMQTEDLYISPRLIRVDYRFLNGSARDVRALVAFPLPDIAPTDDEDVAVPSDDPQDPFRFRLTVDGRLVAARLDAHAISHGVDRTALLRSLHLPLIPGARGLDAALDRLPAATRETLKRLKLVTSESSASGGDPMQEHLGPDWTFKAAYVWTQDFPPGRPVAVHHEYAPSVGSSVQTGLGLKGWRTDAELRGYVAAYCPDKGLLSAIAAATAKRRADSPPFFEQRIDYVLHTGANWAAPIGRYHLTLDKGSPKTLLSVCLTGLRKTSDTRFEWERTAFHPVGDLKVLLLTPE